MDIWYGTPGRKEAEIWQLGIACELVDRSHTHMMPMFIEYCIHSKQPHYCASDHPFFNTIRVDNDLRIKVGDFDLARDVYSNDYYRANKNAKLPVK